MALKIAISSNGLEILKGSEDKKQTSLCRFLQQKLFALDNEYLITEIISVQNVLNAEHRKTHLVYLSYEDNKGIINRNERNNNTSKTDNSNNNNSSNNGSINTDPSKSNGVINFPSDEEKVIEGEEILTENMMVIDDISNEVITNDSISSNLVSKFVLKYMWIVIDIPQASDITVMDGMKRSQHVIPSLSCNIMRDPAINYRSSSNNSRYNSNKNSNTINKNNNNNDILTNTLKLHHQEQNNINISQNIPFVSNHLTENAVSLCYCYDRSISPNG